MLTVEDVRRLAMTLPRTTEGHVGGSPDKFMLPQGGGLRHRWVLARIEAIDEKEMRELVIDAWRMVVPKSVAAAHQG